MSSPHTKTLLFALALVACSFSGVAAVVKPRPLPVARASQECLVVDQEAGSCNAPFLVEIRNVLTPEECDIYREIPIQAKDGKNGKIPVPATLLQKLLTAMDQAEQRPVPRKLVDTDAFQDQHQEIILSRRRKLTESSDLHVDRFIEGRKLSTYATGRSAFLFLATNEEAYFQHGGVRIPVEAGKLVVFASDVMHRTVIPEGSTQSVDILGAFDTDHLYAVQGFMRIDEVYIDEVDATTSPGPNITVGAAVEMKVALSSQYQQLDVVLKENTLGAFSCPNDTLGDGGSDISYMNCTLTFTATEGAFEGMVNLTNTMDDYFSDEKSVYYTGVVEDDDEEEETCEGLFCRLFCNTFLRFVPFLCRIFGKHN